MPEALTYIITIPTTTTTVSVRGGGSANNGGVAVPVPIVSLVPIQVAGLVPMIECGSCDCRQLPINCCDKLKVFGRIINDPTVGNIAVAGSSYENDVNDFLFDIQLIGTTVTWTIEKCKTANVDTPGGFQPIATITNNTYGRYNALTTLAGHPTYSGFTINWGRILLVFGIGEYRIVMNSNFSDSIKKCYSTPAFELRAWNCHLADRTVKFEIINAPEIGNCNNDGSIFNMCGLSWFSSIRVPGKLGENTVTKYDELYNKWQNGKMEMVHNEAIQKWKFDSLKFSKPYHDRLKIYMMMALERRVSDYNIFNVDYSIKQLCIVPAGNYEPVDYNSSLPPQSSVTVEFNSGIQNIIASNCCNLK